MTRSTPALARPRLGFLGLGWIGTHRLRAIASSGRAEISALSDASPGATKTAAASIPDTWTAQSIDDLLQQNLDGVVIATPSGLHAAQAIAALERGMAVFCQKPLARNAFEAKRVVDTARDADRLLGVDLSYRHLASAAAVRDRVARGEIGDIYAVDLVFHNAYGPDKSWCRDPELAGGGCVIDLGVHLVDLGLWMLQFPPVESARARLYSAGRRVSTVDAIEDHCDASIELESGVSMRMTCSWHAPIGQDAVIRAAFTGTRGSAVIENVDGSFYDFAAFINNGSQRRQVATDHEGWGGRAALAWVDALARGERFDAAADRHVEVSAVLDRIYER